MRRMICAALVLLATFPIVVQASDPQLRAYLETRLKETKAPSISVAVAANHEIVLAVAVGFADVQHKTLATPQTQYRVYSISKAITAVAIMQLWEQRKVDLEDDIREYVLEWPPSTPPIRIVHLLTHTSGIRHYKKDAGEISSRVEYPSLAAAIEIFKNDPLEFDPGTGYRYTSFGFNLLSGVIESVSASRFGDYLSSDVFLPAGMTQSVLHVQSKQIPLLAEPYYVGGWRKSLKHVEALPNMSSRYAAGGIVSTPTDLVRLLLALENEVLLTRETVAKMFSVPFPALNEKQAYGWYHATTDEGVPVSYVSGAGMGYTGLLMHYPTVGVSGALLVNVADFDDRVEILDHVLAPYLAAASTSQ